MPSSHLDVLLEIAAEENIMRKHELEVRGRDLSFWAKPMKIAEYQSCKKASKNPEDLLEVSARLLIKKAHDQAGNLKYQVDALPVLMNVLSMETAAKIIGALNAGGEEEEIELDFKSPETAARKGKLTTA